MERERSGILKKNKVALMQCSLRRINIVVSSHKHIKLNNSTSLVELVKITSGLGAENMGVVLVYML